MALHSAKEIELLTLFAKLPLFSGITTEALSIFTASAIVKSIPKGEIIYIEEEKAEYFYIIQKGWIKLFRETLDGSEAVIDILSDFHIFAEFTIFDNGVYSSSAEAVEDSVLISLPTNLLKEQINQNQTLVFNMFSAMSHRQKQQDKTIEHLTILTASQRIGCFLLRLCPKNKTHDIVIQLPYDKLLLASRLGMQPETFSRALSTLRKKTGINVSGARIDIDDISNLSNFVCSGCSSSYPCEDANITNITTD